MNTKYAKFLSVIEEALQYNSGMDVTVRIFESTLFDAGLNKQDLLGVFKKASSDGIVLKKEIMFAPKTETTNPAIGWSSVRSHDNDQPVYTLSIDAEKLHQLKPSVARGNSKFSDTTAQLEVDGTVIQLPPHKNEHWLCKAAFEYAVSEPIDWEELYEKMTGYYREFYGKPKSTRQNWRQVYDAMEAINERISEKGFELLFEWQEKTLKRNR